MAADTISIDQTRASAAVDTPTQPTKTRTINDIVQSAGHLRYANRLLAEDVGETHRQALELQLNILARQLAKQDPRDTLNSLADKGFAWRDIARLVGVSVPAVRRWRQGEPPTGSHLFAIGRLAAFIEILNKDHMVANPVPWLEMPLSDEVPLTGIDVAASGRYEELIDLAADHMGPEDVLTRLNPNWREDMRSDVEVFRAEDGELGLRSRVHENR